MKYQLLAFTLIVACPLQALAESTWTMQVQKDELTDVPRYMIYSESTKKVQPPTGMGVVCTDGKAAIMFITGLTGVGESYTVHYRFDKEPAETVEATWLSATSLAVLEGKARSIIKKMKNHEQVYFRAVLPTSSVSDGTVSLSGFSEELAKFEKACG